MSGAAAASGGGTSAVGGDSSTAGTAGAATAGTGAANGGAQTGGVSGGGGASSGGAGAGGGGAVGSCVGKTWPTADPTKAGPFQVTTDKNVGPLAGVVPDPVYGSDRQRFNVYRPSNLADSGYCHPILIWANGYRDNPEQNPPDCVVDANAGRWCGQYGPMVKHLASHGFVVVAPLSTATAEGDPLPTIAGLDWIFAQAEDSTSPYYHRLDTVNVGQLGHSYGGMSTCLSASEPRYKALATVCGTRALSGVHTPMLFFCGGKDTTVQCSGVKTVFQSVTEHPAFFMNELNADHGSWVYQGASGVSLSAAAAWFRVHLMNDTANRNYFYGSGCKFCSDNRVQAEQNSLMK
ncbi:MAG: endo,4-beta-glucanase [Polyangiaceae bacterium]|jgi:dienelactone hydrolase|nr:endo,4-beta-glucanase [Polyangiaceae bacterium]